MSLKVHHIIAAINRVLKPFSSGQEGIYFRLSQHKRSNIFRLQASGYDSLAQNRHGNSFEKVNVLHWFSDYWLFVEIKFLQPQFILISLSVFQGEVEDQIKNQLFRAEWDDYCVESNFHPQPHWHFINNKSIENTMTDFVDLIPEGKETFEEMLSEEKNKIVDLTKFHFAMKGSWSEGLGHIHPINDIKKTANWFGGLLAYLKTELEFIDAKRKN